MGSGAAQKILEAAEPFRPRILKKRERIEAGRRLPDDLTRELARAGLFRKGQPDYRSSMRCGTPLRNPDVLNAGMTTTTIQVRGAGR